MYAYIGVVVLGADVQHLLHHQHVAGAGVGAHGQRGLAQRLLRLGQHLQRRHRRLRALLATYIRFIGQSLHIQKSFIHTRFPNTFQKLYTL